MGNNVTVLTINFKQVRVYTYSKLYKLLESYQRTGIRIITLKKNHFQIQGSHVV